MTRSPPFPYIVFADGAHVAGQALTPAMEGWRKRIARIATNFEAANKDIVDDQDSGNRMSEQAGNFRRHALYSPQARHHVGRTMQRAAHSFRHASTVLGEAPALDL
jgi:hypothetical protein